MKKTGTVYKGPAKPKADVTIILSDDTFSQLAEGKLDGQKAYMTGKLKTKGNMMLATKLSGVLQVRASTRLGASKLTCIPGGEDQGEALTAYALFIPVH
jgi:putative sterol carrier protein